MSEHLDMPVDLAQAIRQVALKRKQIREEPGDGEQLRRRLTAFDLTLLGIGASIGSGIFVIFGVAVRSTGPAVCISFLLAGLSCVFSALCYAELAALIPTSGSVYLYAYAAFGEFIAVTFGLNTLIDYHVGAALGVSTVSAYLRGAMRQSFGIQSMPSDKVTSVSVLVVFTAILCIGVERGLKRVNGILVVIKVSIVVLIIAVGCTKMEPANLTPFQPYGLGAVASMATTVTFSYTGFGAVANAAEECVNPNRDLPIGILGSLGASALLYCLFAIVLCGLIPFGEMDEQAPVVAAFGPQYGNVAWIAAVVDWGAIVGVLTTLLVGLYSQARMYLAMSRDGILCKALGYVPASLGTPVNAQILCGLVASLLTVALPLESLVRYLNIGVIASYTVVCGGVLVLRAQKPIIAGLSSVAITVVSVAAGNAIAWLGVEDISVVAVIGVLLLVVVIGVAWVPMLLQNYAVPMTFACPCCPVIPLLGITVNGFMLSQCHWEAWVRLAVTTLLIVAGYAYRVRKVLREGRSGRLAEHGMSLQPE